jgi:hypothetical protein
MLKPVHSQQCHLVRLVAFLREVLRLAVPLKKLGLAQALAH